MQADPDFEVVDLNEWEFKLPKVPPGTHLPVFTQRKPVLALTLFKLFLPESLLEKIWVDNKEANPLVWQYGAKTRRCINGGVFILETILLFLACQIRIIGLQKQPKENEKNRHPLRHSFSEARDHFGRLLSW